MALNKNQRIATNFLKNRENVFLSGEGGTGKSYVIDNFTDYLTKNGIKFVVCAPTGLAAMNVNGATLHRTFKLSTDLADPDISLDNVLDAEVIIIDEISMCRRDIFQKIARALIEFANPLEELPIEEEAKLCRKKQLVVVGDFFQLPPVLGKNDKKIIEQMKEQDEEMGTDFYKDFVNLKEELYAFQCEEWDAFNFKTVLLDEVVRQSDKEYIDNLNKIRRGDAEGLDFIKKQSSQEEIKDAIYLTSRNADADNLNQSNLDKIKSKEYLYRAEESGQVSEADKPVPSFLKFKVGARVMSVVNISSKEDGTDIVNGLCGTVISLDDDTVTVRFDDNQTYTFEKYKWSVKGFEKRKINEDGKIIEKMVMTEIGSYRQIPLKLSWAITVHKSQGQSYDAVNLDPDCFIEGQLYVALSRAKDIKKLYLTKSIKEDFLKTSNVVKKFYENIDKPKQQKDEIQQLTESEVAITKTEVIDVDFKEVDEIISDVAIIEEIDTKKEKLDIVDEINETREDKAPDTDEDYIMMNIPKAFEKKVLSILKDESANEINNADNLERDLEKANASNIRKDMKIHKLEKQIEELTQELEKLKASSGRRPKISKDVELRIVELRKLGLSMNKIASRVGVGDGTVMRVLSDHNIN